MGWQINTEVGTVALLEQKHLELLQLLAILATQRRMGQKELENFVGKLRSIHLAVPGAVAHLYHIQCALTQGVKDRYWILADFHQEIRDQSVLVEQTVARPTHLAEIIRQETTHLGFCDASGIRAGGVWLNPSVSGTILVWRHTWLPNTIAAPISDSNP